MKTVLPLVLSILSLITISCKDGPRQSTEEPEVSKDMTLDTTKISRQMCYLYAVDKDSITLNLLETNEKIQGQMNYNFYQIDGSFGTFNGIMKGDTLIGVYNFEAEGSKSRRELVFLKTNNGLLQGSGETEIVENTEMFKKGSHYNFENGRLLKSVECKE